MTAPWGALTLSRRCRTTNLAAVRQGSPELAVQVQKEVQSFVPLDMDIRCMAVHGGSSKEDQVSRLCGTVDGATIHVV